MLREIDEVMKSPNTGFSRKGGGLHNGSDRSGSAEGDHSRHEGEYEMEEHLSSTMQVEIVRSTVSHPCSNSSHHNGLWKRARAKERLKGFGKEVLRLLEGMRMAEEEWARLALRVVSQPRKEGNRPWS